MIAGLTHEQRTVVEHGGVITRLGHLRCLDCWGDESLDANGATWTPLDKLDHDDTDCDNCGRHLSQTLPRLRIETVTIEYVACKIF